MTHPCFVKLRREPNIQKIENGPFFFILKNIKNHNEWTKAFKLEAEPEEAR